MTEEEMKTWRRRVGLIFRMQNPPFPSIPQKGETLPGLPRENFEQLWKEFVSGVLPQERMTPEQETRFHAGNPRWWEEQKRQNDDLQI